VINQVVLTGNLAREIELRQTAKGIAYARVVLAVNRSFANKDGQREADFIECIVWRQKAEAIHKYLRKGSGWV
jgi:single-strand DNA-binding protein